jgi:formate dehydrogenase major subunit
MNAVNRIEFSLDGHTVSAAPGESILAVAKRLGIEIPHLCYKDGMRADGNCRVCMVEIEGERVLAPSCCRHAENGMVVRTDGERAGKARKMVLELLSADISETAYTADSELDYWCRAAGVEASRFARGPMPKADLSHPAMAVNLDACIKCTRCQRACREVQANDVIGYAFRGEHSKIVFDLDDPMGGSSCVGCGECVQACPTGALMPSGGAALEACERTVDSVCPYCGVGCLTRYHIDGQKIRYVTGRDGPANHGRLCVKGRFGFDYVSHPQRLVTPLVRRQDIPKGMNEYFDPADPLKMFRPASWDEALDLAAGGLSDILARDGGSALAGFGSAKGSNEEAYLFQKLVRTGFRTNNVDHCTRLCHASSVAALLEGIGSGAVSNQVSDVSRAEVVVIIGSNTTVNHPVAATFMKNAAREGVKLIVMDPVETEMARHAHYFLKFKADTDVALLKGMMHTIVEEDLVDRKFVDERTQGFDELVASLEGSSAEEMAPICGIDAATIREVARLFARSPASMIFWGMGISQHIHGTDNARCLIALSLMTGQIGRPGTGLHPLRGQNNVQGASDAGLIPMMFPDYRRVDNDEAHRYFSEYWGADLDAEPGLTVVEIMEAIHAGKIRGMYIMGENPAMSDPNLAFSRGALERLEHLVVQDIFLTETAAFADVVLPASAFPEKTGTFTNTDRRVQLGRQAVEMPGDARQDLWIIQEIANRLGLDWGQRDVASVYEEMRVAMPSIAGIHWDRLERFDSLTYPNRDASDAGQSVVFQETFPTADGRARFVPVGLVSADEQPDRDYPFVLITGRQLEHWHTGAMTRRASMLDAIEPEPVVSVHPEDLKRLGISEGGRISVRSRRGAIEAYARAHRGLSPGQIFMPFCYHEAAANLLTNEALDPFGKIPEFKYCAVDASAA